MLDRHHNKYLGNLSTFSYLWILGFILGCFLLDMKDQFISEGKKVIWIL